MLLLVITAAAASAAIVSRPATAVSHDVYCGCACQHAICAALYAVFFLKYAVYSELHPILGAACSAQNDVRCAKSAMLYLYANV